MIGGSFRGVPLWENLLSLLESSEYFLKVFSRLST